MYFPPQNLSSNSLLTQALTAEQIQLDTSDLSPTPGQSQQHPDHAHQQQQHMFSLQQQQQQQHLHQQHLHQQQRQQYPYNSWPSNQLSSSAPTDIPHAQGMNHSTTSGASSGLPSIRTHKDMPHDLQSTGEWTSFLAPETLGDVADADMEQILQGNVNEENWGSGERNHFSMPDPPSFMDRAGRQQRREIPGDSHQHQQQHPHHQHLQQLHQQEQIYQLQQQQLLRIQLELASQTQLPQSPAPGVSFSSSTQYMPHQYVSGLSQFPTGLSPANSPLSPGNYAGDDYFTSRQVSPGPAASPGGTAKIKSRPRIATAATRVSQGGIKALFGQSLPKSNRTSLDLKTESALQLAAGAKTPPLKKKAPKKSLSAEILPASPQMVSAAMGAAASHSTRGSSTPTSETSPPMTLAERRAAAASGTTADSRDTGSPSLRPASAQSKLGSLIPPNLGLDTRAKGITLPSTVTPGSEAPPPSSPALLSTSASSPAPIQIGRIVPRNSSSQTRTEEQQKLLDDAMERVDFEDVTVAELKEMLRQRGQHGGGKKADLIKRLQAEIEKIRAGRNPANRSSAASAPMPIGSPTSSLHWTMGNMHIGSPPIHSNLSCSPSARRYTPYSAPLASPGGTVHLLGTSPGTGVGASIPTGNQGLAGTASHLASHGVGASAEAGSGAGLEMPGSGQSSAATAGHASSLPRNIAMQGGRDASALPAGSPRMSLLGSSFISSDGTVHQNPIHPLNQRHQTQGSGLADKKSPPPTHPSPAGSGLRNSQSPESNSFDDAESDSGYIDMIDDHSDDHSMDSDTLHNEVLRDPKLISMNGQGFTMDGSYLASLNGRLAGQGDVFALRAAMTVSLPGTAPSLASSSSASVKTCRNNARQQSPLGQELAYSSAEYDSYQSSGLVYDDACVPHRSSSADIKLAEDEFLTLSPALAIGNPIDHYQQQQQQQYGIHQVIEHQSSEDHKHQLSMFEFDPHFSAEGAHQHQQSFSQDDLDMLLLGSQTDDMSFHPSDTSYTKDTFMW